MGYQRNLRFEVIGQNKRKRAELNQRWLVGSTTGLLFSRIWIKPDFYKFQIWSLSFSRLILRVVAIDSWDSQVLEHDFFIIREISRIGFTTDLLVDILPIVFMSDIIFTGHQFNVTPLIIWKFYIFLVIFWKKQCHHWIPWVFSQNEYQNYILQLEECMKITLGTPFKFQYFNFFKL